MAVKRISRARKRDLQQPDEFITWSARLLAVVGRYRVPLMWALAGVVAIAAITSGYGFYVQRSEAKASAQLFRSVEAYEQERSVATPAAALDRVKDPMGSLIDTFDGRAAANMGRYLLGHYHYEAGQPEEAATLYREALGGFEPGSDFHSASLLGLAYAHEAAGDLDAALDGFMKVSEASNAFFRSEGLANAARIHRAKGDSAKSRELLDRLMAENPGYLYTDMIASRLAAR